MNWNKFRSEVHRSKLIPINLGLHKSPKSMIGIDIGTSTIKLVQMNKNHKIATFGMESIPEGMMNQGRIIAQRRMAELIKNTIRKYRIKGTKCSLCISGNEILIREIKLPEMNEAQIIDNIQQEITNLMPFNHVEYCIDYKIIKTIQTQNSTQKILSIMVAAAPNSLVQAYIDTLKKANLKVCYIDIIPNIACKIMNLVSDEENQVIKQGNICLIDFGARNTNVVILKDGNYYIHKNIANGGDYLTAIIAKNSDLDIVDAEKFKIVNNFFDESQPNPMSRFVMSYYDYLITDFERTFDFFKNQNNQKGIDQIYIMGGGSLVNGLSQYLEKNLSVKVSKISDILNGYRNGNDYDSTLAYFPYAFGTTMREEKKYG